jgi:hypothetical protein
MLPARLSAPPPHAVAVASPPIRPAPPRPRGRPGAGPAPVVSNDNAIEVETLGEEELVEDRESRASDLLSTIRMRVPSFAAEQEPPPEDPVPRLQLAGAHRLLHPALVVCFFAAHIFLALVRAIHVATRTIVEVGRNEWRRSLVLANEIVRARASARSARSRGGPAPDVK